MENRKMIAIMNWDDQFDVAATVLGCLDHHGIEISDEIEEDIIESVLAMTDDFSTGESADFG